MCHIVHLIATLDAGAFGGDVSGGEGEGEVGVLVAGGAVLGRARERAERDSLGAVLALRKLVELLDQQREAEGRRTVMYV